MLTRRGLNDFKKLLQRDDVTSLVLFLSTTATADDLKTIREQKLLMHVRNRTALAQLTIAYAQAAVRLMSEPEYHVFSSYVSFLTLATDVFRGLAELSRPLLEPL